MKFLAALTASAILTLAEAWVVMLLVGVIHEEVSGVPAIGYGTTVAFVYLINMLAVCAVGTRNAGRSTP